MPALQPFFVKLISNFSRLALALALLAVPLAGSAAAQPPAAPDNPAGPAAGEISGDQAIAAVLAAAGELGANDMRLSDMGADKQFGADQAAVAYNPTHNEYLVVWRGDDNTPPLVYGEHEIFGQRVDAATGEPLGADFRVSEMGPDGDVGREARSPAVAYSSFTNEYLVVWYGDGFANDEFEIFGQRINADTGQQVGTDSRLSDMGPDGSSLYSALLPRLAYNPIDHQFLVVWTGDDNTGSLADEEYEIFGQLVDSVGGTQVGSDFRISDVGPDGDAAFDANNPVVVFNPQNARYLVAWWGDDDTGPLVNGENEIFGQLLNAAGQRIAPNNARLSDMGPDGLTTFGGFTPAVDYNSVNNQFFVAWYGTDSVAPGEAEIYGQRLAGLNLQELGTNDLRLSDMGPTGVITYGAVLPTVAYNSANNEFLVAWHGDDNTGTLVDEEYEVFGQRVNAATGAEVGANDARLSDMGPNGDTDYGAFGPALAYSSVSNQYLVVWQGDDDTADLINNEYEIFGQRVAGGTGAELGADARISDMGGDLLYDASNPAVAYNSRDHEYLVVWSGDDNTGGLVDEEFEIYGQRVDAVTGQELGGDFRLSDMGPDGNPVFDAWLPQVAFNSANDEYLVVWQGRDSIVSVALPEDEIFGQRVAGATGAELGSDIRLSDLGPDGDADYFANDPSVVYNSQDNEYLVVWSGNDDTGSLGPDEEEVFGQRVNAATGAQVGPNDARLSDMGPNGDGNFNASRPMAAYGSAQHEYLVVWQGVDDTGALVVDEAEIYGQRLAAGTGLEIGANDQRISFMGPDGDPNFDAYIPTVAYNTTAGEYLVAWQADDNSPGLVDGKVEIWGQRLAAANGAALGGRLRLTTTQPFNDVGRSAFVPKVIYAGPSNTYMLSWSTDDAGAGLANDEIEVLARRLAGASGLPIGRALRLSDAGPDGEFDFHADYEALAYNSDEDEFLAVWNGDDNVGPLVNREDEIFGQRFFIPDTLYLPLLRR